jgi:hypothetical protein
MKKSKSKIFVYPLVSIFIIIAVFLYSYYLFHATDPETEQFTINVFDHELPNNKDHPATTEIIIPNKKIIDCSIIIEGYLDLDDLNRRGVYFYFDNIGGKLVISGEGPTNGDTICGGNFNLKYSLSYIGTINPGNHSIEAYISSDDSSSGAVIESWISIRLEFNRGFTPLNAGIISLFFSIVAIIALYEFITNRSERLQNKR